MINSDLMALADVLIASCAMNVLFLTVVMIIYLAQRGKR